MWDAMNYPMLASLCMAAQESDSISATRIVAMSCQALCLSIQPLNIYNSYFEAGLCWEAEIAERKSSKAERESGNHTRSFSFSNLTTWR
jgi:hypothetical protein